MSELPGSLLPPLLTDEIIDIEDWRPELMEGVQDEGFRFRTVEAPGRTGSPWLLPRKSASP
ncbi:hypothetical protein Q8791_27730 [Nocardiopsis sp. CT-R113]|uniref:Uncharacterized protein n=1 Tax=Nocardiopsis codii TaxID=3065942 RepID=A0ABU7KFM8_9ACTN|nr:hypothetical protein [Nocardiopsis sp. CT-R113]MEE2041018.1 hypothetical protein [Nocardiopsis sp. CT-R113]